MRFGNQHHPLMKRYEQWGAKLHVRDVVITSEASMVRLAISSDAFYRWMHLFDPVRPDEFCARVVGIRSGWRYSMTLTSIVWVYDRLKPKLDDGKIDREKRLLRQLYEMLRHEAKGDGLWETTQRRVRSWYLIELSQGDCKLLIQRLHGVMGNIPGFTFYARSLLGATMTAKRFHSRIISLCLFCLCDRKHDWRRIIGCDVVWSILAHIMPCLEGMLAEQRLAF